MHLLWGEAVLAHDAGLVAGLPAVDESLVEEAHRVGDVTTGATLGSGACGGVFEGTWPGSSFPADYSKPVPLAVGSLDSR